MDAVAAPVPAHRSLPPKVMQLPPLQTSFAVVNPTQRVRPPTSNDTALTEPPIKLINVSTETLTPKDRTSRGGLWALFRRKKAAKNLGTHEEHDTIVKGARATRRPASRDTKASHNTARLLFDQENNTTVPRSRTLRRQSSTPVPRSRSLKRELTIRTPATWDPPPLFQAYPQAVKYASLRAPTVSTDAILRSNGNKKNTNAEQYVMQSASTSNPVSANVNIAKSKGYSKRKRKHNFSEPIPKECWTNNLYVLVTSGYLLQYAGEGSFDRLPEKIMTLSKDSAAFASDVILGEHWVLQVSQISDDDGVQSGKEQESIMKKIGFLRDTKRCASSFLLVMDNPAEMDSWLRVVRGEIESMGGKKYCPDAGVRGPTEESPRDGREKLSHRYSMGVDHDQHSGRKWEPAPDASFGNVIRENGGSKPIARPWPSSIVRRPSIASQMSSDSPTISNPTPSINQTYLDQLRGSPRLSYASTGAKTLSTSRGSSPGQSPRSVPAKLHFPLPDHTSSLGAGVTPVSILPKSRRASAQISRRPSADANSASRSTSRSASRSPRPLSTRRSLPRQDTPPAAPNFSVPTFSKRNSIVTRIPSSSMSPALRSPVDDKKSSLILNSPPTELSTEADDFVQSLPHSSSSYELSSLPSNNGRPLPRRLSSLQYSRGISPRQLPANALLSPHPPPKTALPAVPRHLAITDQGLIDGHLSQSRQLCRPMSMQVRSDPVKQVHIHLPQSRGEDKLNFDLPSQSLMDFPARQNCLSPILPVHRSKVQNRRSMPEINLLVDIPPTSLPPLPKTFT